MNYMNHEIANNGSRENVVVKVIRLQVVKPKNVGSIQATGCKTEKCWFDSQQAQEILSKSCK